MSSPSVRVQLQLVNSAEQIAAYHVSGADAALLKLLQTRTSQRSAACRRCRSCAHKQRSAAALRHSRHLWQSTVPVPLRGLRQRSDDVGAREHAYRELDSDDWLADVVEDWAKSFDRYWDVRNRLWIWVPAK
jgi:hypothetical protein